MLHQGWRDTERSDTNGSGKDARNPISIRSGVHIPRILQPWQMVRMTGVGCQLYLLTVFPSACSLNGGGWPSMAFVVKESSSMCLIYQVGSPMRVLQAQTARLG